MDTKTNKLAQIWKYDWCLVQENWRLLLILNLMFFLSVVVGWILQSQNPNLEASFWVLWQEGGAKNEVVQWSLATWWGSSYLLTLMGIFLINFTAGSLIYLTLPSLVIPGIALFLVLIRGIIWGVISNSLYDYGLGTILLEGSAYVTATFAALLHARAWLRPASVPTLGRNKAYLVGFKINLKLQLLVALQLLIAAIYETTVIIYA